MSGETNIQKINGQVCMTVETSDKNIADMIRGLCEQHPNEAAIVYESRGGSKITAKIPFAWLKFERNGEASDKVLKVIEDIKTQNRIAGLFDCD